MLSLVYPYYNNPEMLEYQIKNWEEYREQYDRPEIIIVDDHSAKSPVNFIPDNKKYKLLRFTEKGIWGMHEARNLGAQEAKHSWLVMSDIDHVLEPSEYNKIIDMLPTLSKDNYYTFDRLMAPHKAHNSKYHCNSFLVHSSKYWEINGYDVDLTGTFGGGYGGDGVFLGQLAKIAPRIHLNSIHLLCFPDTYRGHGVIKDANTTEWERTEWKQKYVAQLKKKQKEGRMKSINPVRRKWEKLI